MLSRTRYGTCCFVAALAAIFLPSTAMSAEIVRSDNLLAIASYQREHDPFGCLRSAGIVQAIDRSEPWYPGGATASDFYAQVVMWGSENCTTSELFLNVAANGFLAEDDFTVDWGPTGASATLDVVAQGRDLAHSDVEVPVEIHLQWTSQGTHAFRSNLAVNWKDGTTINTFIQHAVEWAAQPTGSFIAAGTDYFVEFQPWVGSILTFDTDHVVVEPPGH